MTLADDLRYPMNEAGWLKTIAIGTVLEYLSFLIVPGWVLMGYYVRVCRDRLAGDPEPPSFEDPKALLVDGLKSSVIFVSYNLVTLVVFLFLVVGAVIGALNGDFWAALGSILFGLLVTAVLLVLFTYVGSAGMVRFAETGSMASAYSPALLKTLVSPAWLLAWVKLLAVGFAVGVVLTVVSLVPVVQLATAVLGPAAAKYLGTVSWKLLTDAYVEIRDADVEARPEPDAAPA